MGIRRRFEVQLPMLVLDDGARKVGIFLFDQCPCSNDQLVRHRSLQLECQTNVHRAADLFPESKWPELSHDDRSFEAVSVG